MKTKINRTDIWPVSESKETLYDTIKAAGIEHSNHESDLYLPDTPEVRAILDRFPISKGNAQRFTNQITKTSWIDVPFAFLPWWRARCPERKLTP